MERPRGFSLILQFEVDSGLVGKTYTGEHLHRLVIFHYFHRSDIFVAYAVGGNSVFAAEHVGAFDIELVYVLALILYLA